MHAKLVILAVSLLVITFASMAFLKEYPNSGFAPYNPGGPSYKNDSKDQVGVPVKQMDQGADAGRRATIENLELGLKQYYAKYNKAPKDLNELAAEGFVKSIKNDQVTNQPPSYFPDDPQYGCRAEFPLSDGSVASAYCR